MKLLRDIITETDSILVISNKGGVGKTSIAVSLAVVMAKDFGLRVALVDVDITNPSVPHLLGIEDLKADIKGMIHAVQHPRYSIQVISVGSFLPKKDQYVALDGDSKKRTIAQFTKSVEFTDVDIIVVDSPPTTSDEILETISLFDRKKCGAVIVTQPSSLSLNGAMKSLTLLREKGYLVKGIVTNMDGLVCKHCKTVNELFYSDESVEDVAAKYGVPHLGAIPMQPVRKEKLIIDTPSFRVIAEKILNEQGVQFKPKKYKLGALKKLLSGLKVVSKLWRA